MRHIPTTLLILACLTLCGCGDDAEEAAESARAPEQKARDDDEIKTPIVRSLLDALDEVDGDDDDVKDELEKILRESDEPLEKVLGDNSRRLIMQANQRAPSPVIISHRRPKPVKQDEPPAESPADADGTAP